MFDTPWLSMPRRSAYSSVSAHSAAWASVIPRARNSPVTVAVMTGGATRTARASGTAK